MGERWIESAQCMEFDAAGAGSQTQLLSSYKGAQVGEMPHRTPVR